jgi:hypothetical protein
VRHLGTESTSWSDRPGSREMALKRSLKGDDSEKESQVRQCVCLLLQDLLQSCSRGGEEESGGHVL